LNDLFEKKLLYLTLDRKLTTWPLLGFDGHTCLDDFERILPAPKFQNRPKPAISLPFECDGYHSLPVITVTMRLQIRPYYGN
jgi:hypothetical protein